MKIEITEMTEMTDSGYPTPAPVNFPILEVGWEGDSDSDSEDSDDGVVNGTCGRGCTGRYGLQGCCEPNCPRKNSVAQFNVCPMKVQMLAFLCGNDEDLTEIGYCSVRELRGLLRNRWEGVEVSLEEATEVHAMIHENDSGEEEDSEEEAETACGRGCSIEDDDRVENQCSPCNPDRNTIQQFNCCPMKHYNLRDLCINAPLFLSTWDLNIDELREGLIVHFPGLQLTDEEARVLHDEIHPDGFVEEDSDSDVDSEAPPPEPEPLSDTRPLINEEWRRNNPER